MRNRPMAKTTAISENVVGLAILASTVATVLQYIIHTIQYIIQYSTVFPKGAESAHLEQNNRVIELACNGCLLSEEPNNRVKKIRV